MPRRWVILCARRRRSSHTPPERARHFAAKPTFEAVSRGCSNSL